MSKNFKETKEYLDIYNNLNIDNDRIKSMQASR
jgi:hypothetical protein